MSIKFSTAALFATLAVALRLWTWTAWLEPFVVYLHIAVSLLMALNLYMTSAHYKVILVTSFIMFSVVHPALYFPTMVALYMYGNSMFMASLIMTIMPFVILNRGQTPLEEVQGSLILQGANPQCPDDDEMPTQPITQFLDQFPWQHVVTVFEEIEDPAHLTSSNIFDALFPDLSVFGPSQSLHHVVRLDEVFIFFATVVENADSLPAQFTQVEVPFRLGTRNGNTVIGIKLPYPFPIEPMAPLSDFCYVYPWNNEFDVQ